MIYSEMVRKACNIMYEAHKDDVDKGGYPYVFHPFFVASSMPDEISCCVALLHDVVEDHGDKYSPEDLSSVFPSSVIEPLSLLTHDPAVPYMEYIAAVGTSPVARMVKMSDLRHNMDLSRSSVVPPKLALYQEALEYLESLEP
ncbi:MAG: GTP pyrophosphokinase [Clostridiales bacterium]|nr:GTP pyrophosphokinase [Clostridiales bacterium]